MTTLLLELLSEEMPSGLQRDAAAQLEKLWREALLGRGLTHTALHVQHTPRRLVLSAENLPPEQPARAEEKRGPKVGAPQAALDGFLKANGVTLAQCDQRETDKGRFYFVTTVAPALPLAEAVRALITDLLPRITWAKSMRWGAHAFSWGRPLRGILALLDGKPLSGSFSHNGFTLVYAETTVGARQNGSKVLSLPYQAALASEGIVLDSDERRRLIVAQGDALAQKNGLTAAWHDGVLQEVAGLVETPAVLLGSIDAPFMSLPKELLISVMRTHQRYFPLLKPDGSLAPHFLVAANNQHTESHAAIIKGNERVLRARFSDAQFYFDTDKKKPLADFLETLKTTTFHEKLGSVADKAERMATLAAALFPGLKGAAEAARLAKADLASGAVREFPELQGIMGGYYYKGAAAIAAALREHYHPIGEQTECPTAPLSIAVSLTDKIDSLFWLLAAGEKPTGSRDPLGMRRLALAIVRLFEGAQTATGAAVSFPLAFRMAADSSPTLCSKLGDDAINKAIQAATQLLLERGDAYWKNAYAFGINDLKAHNKGFSTLDERALHRAKAGSFFLSEEHGKLLLAARKRVGQILQQLLDSAVSLPKPQASFYLGTEEKRLFSEYNRIKDAAAHLHRHHNDTEHYEAMLRTLAALTAPLHNFFDKVLVNCDDPDMRSNRLGLLGAVRDLLDTYVDFEKLEG